MDLHWILIIVGVVFMAIGMLLQLANMRHLQRTFSFNYIYLSMSVLCGMGGGLSLLIGLILLVAALVK